MIPDKYLGHLPENALAVLPGITPAQGRRLAKQKARADLDAALGDLAKILRKGEGQELAMGQRAGAACVVSTKPITTVTHHPDFPPHLTDKMPVEDVLRALEFQEQGGCYKRNWGRVEFAACESPFGWVLWRAYRTERRIGVPYEIPLQRESSFVELLAIIYPLWAEVHPDESPTDAHLLQGKNWLDYQWDLKKLIPPPPRGGQWRDL